MHTAAVLEGLIALGKRLAILGALTALLGVPIVEWPVFFVWLVLAVAVCTGQPRPWHTRGVVYAAAGVFAALIALGALPRPAIQEGHQVFLLDERTPGIMRELPGNVRATLEEAFLRAHPREQWCKADQWGCWRFQSWPQVSAPFAFSADALFQSGVKYSRLTDRIDFSSLATLRGGFTNAMEPDGPGPMLNWYDPQTDLKRVDMPYVAMFELNRRLVGSRLCWHGLAWWQRADGTYDEVSTTESTCRTIEADHDGRRVLGAQIAPSLALRMQFEPNAFLSWSLAARRWLGVALAALLVLGAVIPGWRRFGLVAGLMAAGLVIASRHGETAHFRWFVHTGGDDPLMHWGLARGMLEYAIQGDWSRALRGGESVFYFMPGIRYVRALAMVPFGDTHFLDFALVLLVPTAFFGLVRQLMPPLIAAGLTGVFVLVEFPDYAAFGFAFSEPCGYLLFLLGIGLIVAAVRNPGSTAAWPLTAGHALLALAIFIRPNLSIAAAFVIAINGWHLLSRRDFAGLGWAIVGFTPVLVMPLHNAIFGHQFVLFTSALTIDANYLMPPRKYWEALTDAGARASVAGHLTAITTSPAGVVAHGLWDAWRTDGLMPAIKESALVICAIGGLLARRASWPQRLLLGAACGLLIPLVFWHGWHRYAMLAWTLTLTTAVALIVDWHARLTETWRSRLARRAASAARA